MNRDKVILYFGGIFFLLALFSAMYFFLERSMGDTGWRIYCMINTERPSPSHGRWILIFNQIPALLGIYSRFSLKNVLILHSIGNVLLFSSFFGLCYARFKNKFLSLAILLSYVLGVGAIYFIFPDLEKHLAAPLLIYLGFHLKFYEKGERKGLLISLPFFFFLALSQPMVLIPLFLMVIMHVTAAKTKFSYWFIVVFLLTAFFKYATGDAYESVQISHLFNQFNLLDKLAYLPNLILGRPIFFAMVAAAAYVLFNNGKYKLTFLYILGFIFYLFVVVLFVPQAHHYPYLLPFTAFSLYLLFSELDFEKLMTQNAKIVTFLFCGILLIECLIIYHHNDMYKERILFFSSIASNAVSQNQSKIVVDKLPNNSSSFSISESAIISTLYNEKTVIVVGFKESEQRRENIKNYLKNFEMDPILDKTENSLVAIEILYNEKYLPLPQYMWYLEEMNSNYFNWETRKWIYYNDLKK